MAIGSTAFKSLGTSLLLTVVLAAPAHAFRCGNKLVRETMHEQEVRQACGVPTTVRHVGTTFRGVYVPDRRRYVGGWSAGHYSGFGRYAEEVVVTEYVYNFGPRKFMRRLLFEGGVLVSIEKLGYGYREDKN